jgi:hypothetical protein
MRDQRRRSERSHHDVAGNKVVDRLPTAAIRHVLQRDAGELRKPRSGDMLLRTQSRRRVTQSWSLLGDGDESVERIDAELGMDCEHDRLAR